MTCEFASKATGTTSQLQNLTSGVQIVDDHSAVLVGNAAVATRLPAIRRRASEIVRRAEVIEALLLFDDVGRQVVIAGQIHPHRLPVLEWTCLGVIGST